MGATSVVIDQMPSAGERLLSGKIDISNVCEPGIIGPDTAPCITRNTMSELRFHAMPHRKDASVNNSTEAMKVRTTP